MFRSVLTFLLLCLVTVGSTQVKWNSPVDHIRSPEYDLARRTKQPKFFCLSNADSRVAGQYVEDVQDNGELAGDFLRDGVSRYLLCTDQFTSLYRQAADPLYNVPREWRVSWSDVTFYRLPTADMTATYPSPYGWDCPLGGNTTRLFNYESLSSCSRSYKTATLAYGQCPGWVGCLNGTQAQAVLDISGGNLNNVDLYNASWPALYADVAPLPTAAPTAAPAAPVAPVVALGNVNCKKCADGAVAITNEATCKAAAAVLGKAYAGTEATAAKPKGCFVCTATQQVKFNPVGDNANQFAQTVCQRTATVRSY